MTKDELDDSEDEAQDVLGFFFHDVFLFLLLLHVPKYLMTILGWVASAGDVYPVVKTITCF